MTLDLSPHRQHLPLTSPKYCQYVHEECDQTFRSPERPRLFFAYASNPRPIADAIEGAVAIMRKESSQFDCFPWIDMDPRGQVIFCSICKSMRASATLVADITTLNFNLMFEIGYAIGLGMPVLTVRDTSVMKDQRAFKEIGLLDTLGYVDFSNARDLADGIMSEPFPEPLPSIPSREFRDQPVFVMQAPTRVEGSIELSGALKKARMRYRSFDPVETPRLNLHEARRQVLGSKGVVADMLSPERDKALVHNARSAMVCGMAMAQEKAVLMLMEEMSAQEHPIDYRDVIKTYRSAKNVRGLTREFLTDVVALMQDDDESMQEDGQRSLLSRIDLGDVAAENEIRGLRHYFVETGPSQRARQGHARLVIGRKGTGKTAIFYDVRQRVKRGHSRLIIDLKPDGHQFLELKEALLDRLGAGLQEHTMVAFWQYILRSEIARVALDRDRSIAHLDHYRSQRYEALRAAYGPHDPGGDLDFSQRLLHQVDRVTRRLGAMDPSQVGPSLTEVLYSGSDQELKSAIADYLRDKEAIWLLVDNLDKGWPIRGATPTDILVVRSLLDATRKLQREFDDLESEFHCLVFLRSDIHELLLEGIPDKGKDTTIRLDWEDPKVFEQILIRRISSQSDDFPDDFDALWARLCVPLVDGESSFDFIVDRTLMRPRNLLRFIRHAVDVAINRGHERITEDDLLQAERGYSTDVFAEMVFEVADTHPELEEAMYAFEGSPSECSADDVLDRLQVMCGIDGEEADTALDLLLWFGLLGVRTLNQPDPRYAFQVQGNLRRLRMPLENGEARVVVHPAFRSALLCDDVGGE